MVTVHTLAKRPHIFPTPGQTFEHPTPKGLLDALSWIKSEEYQSWLHIRDRFLDDPKSFPINVETWFQLQKLALREVDLRRCGHFSGLFNNT